MFSKRAIALKLGFIKKLIRRGLMGKRRIFSAVGLDIFGFGVQ